MTQSVFHYLPNGTPDLPKPIALPISHPQLRFNTGAQTGFPTSSQEAPDHAIPNTHCAFTCSVRT